MLTKKSAASGPEAKKKILQLFESFRYKHTVHEVFSDFCQLAACTISNAVDRHQYKYREELYMRIISRYTKEEADTFAQILAWLVIALEAYGPTDVLGQVFQELEISSKYRGQFFTPQAISDCVGTMIAFDVKETIKEKGYVTLCEPAVGGGSMVFGFCKAIAEQGFDYTRDLHVTAIDIDDRCANMAYVQMSLLGIPAIVYHGDTLQVQARSAWYTPAHILSGWSFRLERSQECQTQSGNLPAINEHTFSETALTELLGELTLPDSSIAEEAENTESVYASSQSAQLLP
mgnify:CR=1 FL=1